MQGRATPRSGLAGAVPPHILTATVTVNQGATLARPSIIIPSPDPAVTATVTITTVTITTVTTVTVAPTTAATSRAQVLVAVRVQGKHARAVIRLVYHARACASECCAPRWNPRRALRAAVMSVEDCTRVVGLLAVQHLNGLAFESFRAFQAMANDSYVTSCGPDVTRLELDAGSCR